MARYYGSDTQTSRDIQQKRESSAEKKRILLKIANIVVPIVCLCFLVSFMVFSLKVTVPEASDAIDETKAKIDAVNAEISEIEKSKENVVYVDPIVNNAASAVKSVCDLQNQLSEYYYAAALDESGISKSYGDILLSYNNYVGNMKGTVWSDRFSDRYLSLNNSSEMCPYVWTCDSDFIYQGNKTTVTWILYDKSDENRRKPISMVFAEYDNTTGIFTNLRQWLDSHGSESMKRA